MKKKNLGPAGIDQKLVGVFLLLAVGVLFFVSMTGILAEVGPYWLRCIIAEFVTCAPILVYAVYYKKSVVMMLGLNPVKLRVVLLAILVEICVTPACGLCNAITELFTPNVVDASLGASLDETPYILMMVSMALIPALVEELAFRGIIYSAFSRSGRKFAAVLFTALCFGLVHGNINQFAYAFLVGIVFAVVNEAAGSIFPSIAMHFFTNGISITFMYYARNLIAAETQYANMLEQIGEEQDGVTQILLNTDSISTITDAVYITSLVLVAGLAVGGAVLAFKLVRTIARITGRTEHMEKILPYFLAKRMRMPVYGVKPLERPSGDEEPDGTKTRIMNPVLAAGICVWVAFMVFYELLVHGVISL